MLSLSQHHTRTATMLIGLQKLYNFNLSRRLCSCLFTRTFSTQLNSENLHQNNTFFVTTPIFYVNASPHIGHLYTVLLADVYCRWNQLKQKDVIFSTGTDEHGLKIQNTALNYDKSPGEFCDQISETFKGLFKDANISNTDFIRTTEPRHREAVEAFWCKLQSKGYIYKGEYEGWYSVSDESFLSPVQVKDAVINGKSQKVSVDNEQPVIWTKEENYMFQLTAFKERLQDWHKTGVIKPDKFQTWLQQMTNDVSDLSVSRQCDRLSWGIPVPNDPSQMIYVWLDALVNYLTVAGYPHQMTQWPPNYQLFGKDILKFHAIYWPAFLMAAELDLPQKLLCHSHWTVDYKKMSKSIGNVVDPMDTMIKYTTDGLRYFLLKIGSPQHDGNYSNSLVKETINSDIVNTLGNLLSRCTSDSINKSQVFPAFSKSDLEKYIEPEDREFFYSLEDLPNEINYIIEDFRINIAIERITLYLHWANKFAEKQKPWQLVKQDSLDHLNIVIYVLMTSLRTCGILLQPIIPDLAKKLLDRLNVPVNSRTIEDAKNITLVDKPVNLGENKGVLLQRLK